MSTSPPLPSYINQNNLPVSTQVPVLINSGSLPGDITVPTIVSFTNPENALLGYANFNGTPASYNAIAGDARARLTVGFSRYQPISNVASMTLKIDCSVVGLVFGAALVRYSLNGGQTFTTLVEIAGNLTERNFQVALVPTQDLSQVIVVCETGSAQLVFNVFYIIIDVTLFQRTLVPAFPGQQRIGDLMTSVCSKLGNRTDILQPRFSGGPPLVADWLMRSILEITESYDFEELSVTGPLNLTFTTGQNNYPFNFLTNTFNNQPDILTRVRSWFVTPTTNQPFFNGQTTGYQLKYRDIAVVEQVAQVSGTPVLYSRLGGTYVVGPMPDNNYPTYMRYQYQHPFSFDPNLIASIPIQMPTDWLDIIEYAAAQRGAMEERMLDYADYYMKLIYGGATVSPQNGKTVVLPGLIAQRLTQRTRDMSKNERSLKPVVMRT